MCTVRFVLLWLVVLLSGCQIADEDRCLKGYAWDEELLSCRKDPTDADTESSVDAGADTGALPDAGADAGTDTGGEALPIGLEAPCTAGGSECADYPEASYCLYDIRTPDAPGICTIPDCEPGGCPTGYLCCNCFVSVACMSETAAEEAERQGCGCS